MNYRELGVNVTNGTAEYEEVYPSWSFGKDQDPCDSHADCVTPLKCVNNVNSRSVCTYLPSKNSGCTRTVADNRCHVTVGSKTVLCPESSCPPHSDINSKGNSLQNVHHPSYTVSVSSRRIPSQEKCAQAEMYKHFEEPFCMYIDPATSVPEQVPNKCCHDNYDEALEPEYQKYALGPQYYGVFR